MGTSNNGSARSCAGCRCSAGISGWHLPEKQRDQCGPLLQSNTGDFIVCSVIVLVVVLHGFHVAENISARFFSASNHLLLLTAAALRLNKRRPKSALVRVFAAEWSHLLKPKQHRKSTGQAVNMCGIGCGVFGTTRTRQALR